MVEIYSAKRQSQYRAHCQKQLPGRNDVRLLSRRGAYSERYSATLRNGVLTVSDEVGKDLSKLALQSGDLQFPITLQNDLCLCGHYLSQPISRASQVSLRREPKSPS